MELKDSETRLVLRARHNLLRVVREFFYVHGYLEVETSNLMKTVPPDPYIDPLRAYIDHKGPYYLHTSPEMQMKKLLKFGLERIFQICKVYRVEDVEEIHSTEFTMLEWYRKGSYLDAIKETEELVCFVSRKVDLPDGVKFKAPFHVYDLQGLVLEKTGLQPLGLRRDEFADRLEARGFAGVGKDDAWNDLFFKLFIQEVEPKIAEQSQYFIKDWPSSIPTMAKKKGKDKVERFELYLSGIEVANGYTELLDADEQRNRFVSDNLERGRLSKCTFGLDEEFLEALPAIQGPYAGVSVGMDRLLMVLLGRRRIDDVMVGKFKT